MFVTLVVGTRSDGDNGGVDVRSSVGGNVG